MNIEVFKTVVKCFYRNNKKRIKRPSKNKLRKRVKYYFYKRIWQKLC